MTTSTAQLASAIAHQLAMMKLPAGSTEKQKQAARERYRRKRERQLSAGVLPKKVGRPCLTLEARRAKLAAILEDLDRALATSSASKPPPEPSESPAKVPP